MAPPFFDIARIITWASSKRLTSELMSLTCMPEPRAMRVRREPLRSLWLSRSAGVIDWMIASVRTISRSSKLSIWSRICPMPGSMVSIFFMEPMFLSCCIWLRKSVRVKSSPAGDLRCHLVGDVLIERLLRLLDEREDVAHVEDAARHAIRVEDLELLELLTGGGEQDGPPGDLGDGQRGTAASVAVELGEHNAGDVDALLERLRGHHRVLADHRVDDEQHLVGVDRLANVRGLAHQLRVDAQAAGGVDDHHGMLALLRLLDALLGHLDGVAAHLLVLARDAGLGAKTGTPARSPTTCSWVTALGRWRSAATSSGVWPCCLR